MRARCLRIIPALFIILHVFPAFGQNWSCADRQLDSLQKQLSPTYERRQLQKNLDLNNYINQALKGRNGPSFYRTTADSNFTIPVVIHVVHPPGEDYGEGTNITYAQIRSQIEALNAAFGKTYPDYNGQSHPDYAQDTRIRFCLASNSNTAEWYLGPGGTEFGVVRYEVPTSTANHYINATSANQLLAITHPDASRFPFDKFLNIWLVKSIDGGNNIMGYAPRPIMGSYPLDGVVIRADIFGDNSPGNIFPLNFGLAQGKVLAHEIGHYLNLYHIFQGGCAGANPAGSATDACDLNGDMICDIEPTNTQNILCGLGAPNTCTANYNTGTTTLDMINNYMSYADDDCMNTFTQDQVKRMWATLEMERTNLWQSSNLANTGVLGGNGCVPAYLNSQINITNGVFCVNTPIRFSNPDLGNTANSWKWEFPGGSYSSSNKDTVTVTFTAAGNYKAILEVGDGTTTRRDSMVFTVLDCHLDSTMKYMAHWYFGVYGSIDFSSGAPVQTTTALTNNTIKGESTYSSQLEYQGGSVSLSDSSGNLLFYSNAVSVWNKNHQKISTAPIFGASDIAASTGICYVPRPNHPGKYFIVGASSNLFVDPPEGAKFVEVDLNTNTVSSFKEFEHATLKKKLSEMLTVVPHCNGTDYWIITHGYGNEDARFYSFLVTEDGIDYQQAPVISNATHPAFQGSGNQLKSNRSGTKLILASPHGAASMTAGAIYDFNSATGVVSGEKNIPDVTGYNNIQTGAAFSPNEKYFYLMRSSNLATNGEPYWLFQYRVSDMQYNIISAPGFYFASPFQPGPDGQIYVTTQDHYVSRISNPDEWGTVTVNGRFINMRSPNDVIRPGVSIPGFIDARRPIPTHPEFTISMEDCDTYRFTTICFDKYDASWDFGDGSTTATSHTVVHDFAQPGEYEVTLTLSSGAIKHGSVTKKIKVRPLSADIAGPGGVCTNGTKPSQYFGPILPEVNYKWSVIGGSISGPDNFPFVDIIWYDAVTVGTVQLKVSRENCVLTKTMAVGISKGLNLDFNLKDSVCTYDSSFQLAANPPGGRFDGPGVSNGRFSPATAGPGNHVIKYTYFDETSCPGQIEKTIKVRECNIPMIAATNCDEVLNNAVIAPNPVDGVLRFRSLYALKFIQVYNSYGQKVAEGQMTNNGFRLPLLAAGVYTVRVFCERDMSYRAFRFLKL